MFRPNQIGSLERRTGFDVNARPAYAAAVPLPLAIVHDKDIKQKTTVRSDSSASRGAADEVIVDGVILVPKHIQIKIEDRITIPLGVYEVKSVEPRYSVFGALDHTECGLERLP